MVFHHLIRPTHPQPGKIHFLLIWGIMRPIPTIPVTSRREVVVIHPGIPSRQVYQTQQYLQPGIQQTNRGFSIYFRGHHYYIYIYKIYKYKYIYIYLYIYMYSHWIHIGYIPIDYRC